MSLISQVGLDAKRVLVKKLKANQLLLQGTTRAWLLQNLARLKRMNRNKKLRSLLHKLPQQLSRTKKNKKLRQPKTWSPVWIWTRKTCARKQLKTWNKMSNVSGSSKRLRMQKGKLQQKLQLLRRKRLNLPLMSRFEIHLQEIHLKAHLEQVSRVRPEWVLKSKSTARFEFL